MLIDSHCHIHDRSTYNYAYSRQQIGKKLLKNYPDLPHEPSDFVPEKIIDRAHAAGVEKMICIGTSHDDSMAARDFAATHDGIFWSYGIHPDEASSASSSSSHLATTGAFLHPAPSGAASEATAAPVTTGRDEASEREEACLPVAIGEVGLDYRSGESNKKAQIELFESMLQLAKDSDLPLIFHIREAFDDFFAILNNFPDARGVVHSFSDNADNLKKSLGRDFYIGVNGLATFADELPTSQIPLEKMLLETDAPFLTPAPFRGTVNEPARIKEICAYISKLKGESEAKVAEITTKNAERLFKI
ncbi:TatD family hydrolase [Candidatus Saccharibacteria bacterium]|nr:TatD family hydrolase [Candidatus Saccharibacteria bacterium]